MLLIIFVVGCSKEKKEVVEEKLAEEPEQTQIANPASVYCEEQGGKLEIRTGSDGSQTGYCILTDGIECEEWAYYRSECPKKEEKSGIADTAPVTTNPIDVLKDQLIEKWGANCKGRKTDLEKTNCILDWQEKNIFWCYTHPETTTMPDCFEKGYPDCVVDMQFQQMKPGSFPVSKIMEVKVRNGKIFGACYTYGTTYCAVARWNGLKCRVMAVKIITPMEYPASKGDFAAGYCGAAPKDFLDKLGFGCEEWRKIDWIIDADHYWAEVLIDGSWQIMEKPTWAYKRDTQKYIIDAGRDYFDTGW